jgi:hypothetical protein
MFGIGIVQPHKMDAMDFVDVVDRCTGKPPKLAPES